MSMEPHESGEWIYSCDQTCRKKWDPREDETQSTLSKALRKSKEITARGLSSVLAGLLCFLSNVLCKIKYEF